MQLLSTSRDPQKMRHHCRTFRNLKEVKMLAKVLRVSMEDLHHFAHNGEYRTFTVPKSSGGERLIETPEPKLKTVLAHASRFLTSCYYFQRTSAAYGFVINAKNSRDRRNIVTNARSHLRKPYLLNVDLKDFFHSVSSTMVQDIFLKPPFKFSHELTLLLTHLVTHNNRLPMGTPTSPVLSNFATRTLDFALIKYAKENRFYFTRYADDLSFSSWNAITEKHIEDIFRIIRQSGFTVNEKKVILYGENDQKEVTGLILGERVMLPAHFVPALEKELAELENVIQIQNRNGELYTEWVDTFKQRIKGKLNFIAYINGKQHEDYQRLNADFNNATQPPPNEFGAYSWFDFNYKV